MYLLKSSTQFLYMPRCRRSISSIENLNYMARMFGSGKSRQVIAHPIHQLHHILIDMRLFHAAVLRPPHAAVTPHS